jgi:uncharacterized heparinase superfamily protein
MLLTDDGLIFRGVRPLLRLGYTARNLAIGELLPELALTHRVLGLAPRIPAVLRNVPPDAWPGDAQRGRDMVAGIFRFAGQSIEKENLSWQPDAALPEWIAALNGFEWLRDLRSAGGEKARRMAREMVALWIDRYPKYNETTWRADIMGARLMAWIAFHDFFCGSADEAFRKSYFTSLSRQARHLAKALPGELTGLPLMKALRGLAYTGLALEDGDARLEQAFGLILTQINEQILTDGAHISRSPRNTFEFLQCLVDLRTSLISAKIELPEEIQHAIDRITPAVKFFRHGDGGLAQFNGGQEGNAHLCEVTLMHSGARGKANKSLPQCGYERIIQGRSSLIMDTGVPLVSGYSDRAHAGPLSFEYSYGRDRVFVNCGTSEVAGKWRRVLRSTLAHSTLIVDNRSSCQFDDEGLLNSRPTVRSQRHEDDNVAVIQATHDGYVPRFGLTYRRSVCLQEQGEILRGEEQLTGRSGVPFAVRFHLHPDIQAVLEDGEVFLRAKSGIRWRFSSPAGAGISLEESIYVREDENPVPSQQIVIAGQTEASPTVVGWELKREKI